MNLDILRCPVPGCGSELSKEVRCTACGGEYPVLAGVPVLVPDPAFWMATYRDSILASIAEFGVATAESVACVVEWAERAGAVEPMRFGDDWVRSEVGDGEPSPEHAGFAAFLREGGPREVLLSMIQGGGSVLEVGVGAGLLAEELSKRFERVVVGDLSLRAVLHALRRAPTAQGVVLDAQYLPVAHGAFSAVVAEEVVDLLDEPDSFLAGAADALEPRGRFYLATPDPDAVDLLSLLEVVGFEPKTTKDWVPWVRPHHARHFEVYFAQVVEAVVPV